MTVVDHTHDIYEISGAYEKADRYHDHDLSELWSHISGLREDLSRAEDRIRELELAAIPNAGDEENRPL